MNDLISRKALLKQLKEDDALGYDDFYETVENFPTAYDVDKVIEKLEDMSGIQFDGRNESYQLGWCINTERAKEIVRDGGII